MVGEDAADGGMSPIPIHFGMPITGNAWTTINQHGYMVTFCWLRLIVNHINHWETSIVLVHIIEAS